ncbi:tyrosine-type recombinase/integrase [Rhodanobacter aciditrophus]|uniref:Tyrosine-type recombinase/integrase n=1 Tax=Rhodanobacter aciditrophus TaxID=1623218 RepID=A0ABW4B442_9GAMM
MSIKQTKDGWKVDFRAGGANGKRYRKTCKTKAEAERYQKFVEAQLVATGKPWQPRPADRRTLSEIIAIWYQHLGQHLRYNEPRLRKIQRVAEAMGDPIASELKPSQFSQYRSQRIASGTAPSTVNREFHYLISVYNGLNDLGEIDYENPLKKVTALKQKDTEMHYLTRSQIDDLLVALRDSYKPETELVARVCLSTGARWGEAEGLTASRIINNKVTFTDTKGGKNRTIPIDRDLYKLLRARAKERPYELFDNCRVCFRKTIAETGIELPRGQNTHVLRHTFASHFIINGGNILALQRILGHSDISMTMRYAHLAPDHLQDAVKFNPFKSDGH